MLEVTAVAQEEVEAASFIELGLTDAARAELAAIEQELRRRRWTVHPALWVEERLQEFIWSKQREILHSLVVNKKTAVPSCHTAGKSFIAARAAGWWLDTHRLGEAFVVTTATTGAQVKAILWREIGRVQSRHQLPGRTNQTEWWMDVPVPRGTKEELVAFGRKPSDLDPSAFTGIHSKYVLVIADEAAGIPGGSSERPNSLWEAADSLISNEFGRMLAIGNPDIPNSEFEKICSPGSGWSVIHISAFDTPNFTGEEVPKELRYLLVSPAWVEEKRKRWGEKNPLYIAKVLGQFPQFSKDGLLPLVWVRAAQLRELPPGEPNELGVDVGAGGDSSVVGHRLGPVVRILSEDHNPDTMQTCGNVVDLRKRTGATLAKIDTIGIGKGVTDRGIEQGEPFLGINVGEAADDPEHFANRRAELYWGLRERFEVGDVDLDPEDDDTAAELLSLRYRRNSRGQILIESKEEARRRGVPSPNRAEAVMLACAPPRASNPLEGRLVL